MSLRNYSRHSARRACCCGVLYAFASVLIGLAAETPPAEQLLPQDTLAMITVPSWAKLREIHGTSPQVQLWQAPEMKRFREKFLDTWKEEVIEPLERELGIKFKDYEGLIQGQVTIAMLQDGWQGGSDDVPGLVLLLDTNDRSEQLKTNLTSLRRKWVDAGKTLRTETVRGVEFSILPLSTNDIPDTLRKFMPGASDVQELREGEEEGEQTPPRKELIVGQVGPALLLSTSMSAAQKVATRLTGGSLPPLAEVAQFESSYGPLFRNADAFGWINAKVLLENLTRSLAENEEGEPPDPFARVQPTKLISASGLGALRAAAFSFRHDPAGSLFTFSLAAPESERTGILKVLEGEPKETSPPPFVPADVVKYQRWRLDGQKSYAALEGMLREISPQMLSGWNFIINTADQAGKERDPGFDLRQQLMGNLGDDIISYQKAPRGETLGQLSQPPSLVLVGVTNPDQMVAALSMVIGLIAQNSGPPEEREFLGTTVYALELPTRPTSGSPASKRKISFASSRGYVAITTDAATLEEFLRSSDDPGRPLRQLQGLPEAIQEVTGPGTSLLSFENQQESMRTYLEMARQFATNDTPSAQSGMTPVPETLGVGLPRKGLQDWFDFSLLPEFSDIKKYFHFSVYAGSASVDGLNMKMFSPTPPQLLRQPAPSSDTTPVQETESP